MEPLLKKIAGLSAFLFSLSVSAQKTEITDSAVIKKELTVQTGEWTKAYNSKNADNLVSFYTEDAVYVSGHVNGLELDGREKIITYFQNGINGGGHIDKIEILSMHTSCNITTLLCSYQATNSGSTFIGRNLLVMKKVKGR